VGSACVVGTWRKRTTSSVWSSDELSRLY
jgi:hypothetical protein